MEPTASYLQQPLSIPNIYIVLSHKSESHSVDESIIRKTS